MIPHSAGWQSWVWVDGWGGWTLVGVELARPSAAGGPPGGDEYFDSRLLDLAHLEGDGQGALVLLYDDDDAASAGAAGAGGAVPHFSTGYTHTARQSYLADKLGGGWRHAAPRPPRRR